MINIFFRIFFITGLFLSSYILYLGFLNYSNYYVGTARILLYLVFPLFTFTIALIALCISSSKRNLLGFNLVIPIIAFYSFEIFLIYSNTQRKKPILPKYEDGVYKFYPPGLHLLNHPDFFMKA